MGYYCTVPQCTSLAGKTKNVKFHRFPRDVTMADKWNAILKRGKPYTKYSKVCSLHFTQADYNVTTMGQWKTLSKDAVPSQNLPKLHADGSVMVIRKSRTVKYREPKKEEYCSAEKDKWLMATPQHPALPLVTSQETQASGPDSQDGNLSFRLQTLSAVASAPAAHAPLALRPRKQDAIMQTDPVLDADDAPADADPPGYTYPKTTESYESKKYDAPKDYTKNEEDYIPQTNEEYNNEAEKYALERKSHNGYEKQVDPYPKSVSIDSYPKMDMYPNFSDKSYPNRPENWYQNGYADSVEHLRSQQHNLQMLQEQHRLTENQNFFDESHIKQEADLGAEDKFLALQRAKEHADANALYDAGQRRLQQHRSLLEHLSQVEVKQEPEGCESVMQPQGSPYFSNGHNATAGYYGEAARPGAELLIAKQNALAAHTQLWQNTMKRPFFYSENPHYTSPPLLHRYEDISRILQ